MNRISEHIVTVKLSGMRGFWIPPQIILNDKMQEVAKKKREFEEKNQQIEEECRTRKYNNFAELNVVLSDLQEFKKIIQTERMAKRRNESRN